MGKAITEELKKQISEFYRSSDMTNFEIAKALDVSPRSVRRYKNYDVIARPSSTQISQSSPTMESIEEPIESIQGQSSNTIEEPDNIDYEAETTPNEDIIPVITKVRKLEACPECGTPKADWVRLDQLEDDDPQPTEEELLNYDYICPKCMELISVYVCPDCGTSNSEWIPIDQHPDATEEEKKLCDYICQECKELIKISD